MVADAALLGVARRFYLMSAGDQPALLETVTSAEMGSGGFAAATGISLRGRLLVAPTA
jgi:hypothetical protein